MALNGSGDIGWGLLDHLVGTTEQRRGDREANQFRCFEIDNKIEFGRLLYRQVRGIDASQDFVHVDGMLN
jgi:hypothetical protein